MQITHEPRPVIGIARTPSESQPAAGVALPRWHPYLNCDGDLARANLTLSHIQVARMKAARSITNAGRDPVRELDALVQKHIERLRAAAAVSLASFLAECETLIEDINALNRVTSAPGNAHQSV